jgi:hypothetical protein
MRIALLGLLIAVSPAPALPQERQRRNEPVPFAERVQPLLKKFCLPCHSPEKKKGELDLGVFTNDAQVLEKVELWQKALERLNAFEMPPEKAPQPSFEEKTLLNRWFGALPKPKLDCTQLASDRTQRFYKGFVMSRRLTRDEYENAIRDLTGLDLKAGHALPKDGAGGEGFDTNGDTLFSSPILVEKLLDAAERVAAAVVPDRAAPEEGLTPRQSAAKTVGAFARRAFRRTVPAGETDRLLAMFDVAQTRGDSYVASLRLALQNVLVSPHFLFLVEPEPEQEGVMKLGPFPLAQRLAVLLWSSIPDEELLGRAERGELDDAAVRHEIRRMLRDPRSRALGENFALQWLELEPLGRDVRPDPRKFPEYDDALGVSMKEEVVRLFAGIVREDRSLLELLDCDYTWVDERLAKLYGLKPPGPGFQRVTLADRNRGGVLGMAATLAVSSYPFRTSPVLRGKWILEALLGSKVPPPPPGVITLSESSPEAQTLSLRQRLEKHRTQPDCASCHQRMDPLGFGLENFDVLGRWRTHDNGHPVDAVGRLPSGEDYTGVAGLKTVLLDRKDEVLKHLARKLLGYALGRALNKFDDCVVDDALKALKADGYRAGALFETIAMSYPFRHRYVKK